MRTECVKGINYKGSVIVANNLSQKPKQNLSKAQEQLENLVSNTDYNLYLKQDYSKNSVNISLQQVHKGMFGKYEQVTDTGASADVNIASNSSRYTDAAKKLIEDYEAKLEEQKEKEWQREYNKQQWEEIGDLLKGFVLLPFLAVIGMCVEFMQDSGKIFKQIVNKANKLAIKKG